MCTQKMRALSYIVAENITFPPKLDIQTDIQTNRHTYRRTDICFYRVDSLLKTNYAEIDYCYHREIFNQSEFYYISKSYKDKSLSLIGNLV